MSGSCRRCTVRRPRARPPILTSSIERRADLMRSMGASATSSRPAARRSSRSERSVTDSRAAICSRSASEYPETGTAPAAAETSLTRSMAAARLAGTPSIRSSPAEPGTDTGAPGAADTLATRTNVVRVPCRRRRSPSASIPRLMMSWVVASVARSTSDTVMSADDHIRRIAGSERTRPVCRAGPFGPAWLLLRHRRSEHHTEHHHKQGGQQPSNHAHGHGATGAGEIERLTDADDHRDEHPDSRQRERGNRNARNEAEDPQEAWRRGEADRPHQLADIDRGLRFREDPRADLVNDQRPTRPRHQRHDADERDIRHRVLRKTARADAGREARQHDDRSRLNPGFGIRLDLFVNRRVEGSGTDEALKEAIRRGCCGGHGESSCKGLAMRSSLPHEVDRAPGYFDAIQVIAIAMHRKMG